MSNTLIDYGYSLVNDATVWAGISANGNSAFNSKPFGVDGQLISFKLAQNKNSAPTIYKFFIINGNNVVEWVSNPITRVGSEVAVSGLNIEVKSNYRLGVIGENSTNYNGITITGEQIEYKAITYTQVNLGSDYNGASIVKNTALPFLIEIDTTKNKILLKSNNKVYSFKPTEILYETKMTSNTAPAPFVASASSVYSTQYYHAWRAFNGTSLNQDDCWVSANKATLIAPQSITINYGSTKKVNFIELTARMQATDTTARQMPKHFKVLYSDDDIVYKEALEVIEDYIWLNSEKRRFYLKKVIEAQYLKLEIYDNYSSVSDYVIIGDILYGYVQNLTQLPSDSIDNYINYGSSHIDNFSLIYGSKNYILQDTVSENADGLWVQEINRKPLSIKFE